MLAVRTVPSIARSQYGVFTTAQALRAGWTSHALRHATDHGLLVRLRDGVYAVPLEPAASPYLDAAARLRRLGMAVALTHSRMTLSHATAAACQDLPLLATPPLPCVTYARRLRGAVAGAHLHRARLRDGHVVRRGPMLLTSVPRTVVDLGRDVGADACIAAADAALRSRATTPAALAGVLTDCAGWSHTRRAAHAIALADPAAESVLESISRLRMNDAGLPMPRLQSDVVTVERGFCGRVDFYWDEFGVAGEADGMGKYDDRVLSLRDEKRRQASMEDAGLVLVRWSWDELDRFDVVAARLRSAFARGLRPGDPGRGWIARDAWHPAGAVS